MMRILYGVLRRKSIALLIVAVVSVATHGAYFGHPNTVVFDEVHFGKFISAYYSGEYYFDIHPPLGKLVIAGFAKPFGFRPEFSFANIGDTFPDRTYLALRFLPVLTGALLAPVVFLLATHIGLSVAAAAVAGLFVALDNGLLTQSRLILLDPFLLLFGFGSLLSYAKWRTGSSKWFLLAAGVLGGAAAGIKWTGLSFLAIVGFAELFHLWQDRAGTARRRLVPLFICLVVTPFLVYYSAFAIHFAKLPNTGQGDAFMTPRFQKTLTGNRNASDESIRPLGTFGKFIELNREMYRSNQRLTATHPYSSVWYTWPVMVRPIFYWVKDLSRIYLLGNPVVWYGSTAAVLASLWFVLRRPQDRRAGRPRVLMLLLAAFALNFLPFIAIGRVMFLYHYFTALVFAVLILAYLVDRQRTPELAALGLVGLALAAFLYFAPLTYGLPLSPEAYEHRVWLSTWR